MRENNLIIRSVRKTSSLTLFVIRAKKSDCLHDDVENFLLHTQTDTSRLTDKLTSMSTCAGYKGMLMATDTIAKFVLQIFWRSV